LIKLVGFSWFSEHLTAKNKDKIKWLKRFTSKEAFTINKKKSTQMHTFFLVFILSRSPVVCQCL